MSITTEFDVIFEDIKEILSGVSDVDTDDITLDSSLREDLSMDSLSAVEAVLEIEEIFDIEITEDDAENFKTVRDICSYIFNLSRGLI